MSGIGTCKDKNIVIPNQAYNGMSVVGIGEYAFDKCSELTSITIPNSVTYIGEGAFRFRSAIKYIIIPNSITSIGYGAFFKCSGLTSITIPNSVTSISEGAVDSCASLTIIEVSSGNKKYHSKHNCLIETSTKTLIAGCKTSIIPEDGSVTSIGDSAFSKCYLTSITIPASVKSIIKFAFYCCDNLFTITFNGTKSMWNNIIKEDCWDGVTPSYTINCTDGSINKIE